MNLQELIDFHTIGAESCEAYAVTPDADAVKNKDIAKHYNKRAKWHRDAIALVQGLSAGAEPVAAVTPDNLESHRRSWIAALDRLIVLETDADDLLFWQHEHSALRDMYADLDRRSGLAS